MSKRHVLGAAVRVPRVTGAVRPCGKSWHPNRRVYRRTRGDPVLMQDADFSDEFCQFVQSTIPTVEAAMLLLALTENPEVSWEPAELRAKLCPSLRITETEFARCLEVFQSRGLLATSARRFQYRPSSKVLAVHVQTLTQAFSERPVTLIRMIYALRDAKVRSFADAFKLRK